jgi:uncharacterized protein YabN with tetrapyrrole methylase and pyrophosphatase domain
LFAAVNAARRLGLDPEAQLRVATKRFVSRFIQMERLMTADHLDLESADIDQMDRYWQMAKLNETRNH